MAQFILESQRMQELAGINISDQQIVEELLLEALVEGYCLENKILKENLDEAMSDKIKAALSSLTTKGKQAINAISYGLGQVPGKEGRKLYLDAIKDIAKYKISPEEIKGIFSGKKLKEAEGDEEIDYMDTGGYSDEEMKKYGIGKYAQEYTGEKKKAYLSIQKLRDYLLKTTTGKIITGIILSLTGGTFIGGTVYNLLSSPDIVHQVADNSTVNSYVPSETSMVKDINVHIQGEDLNTIKSQPNTSIKYIQFDLGKGKSITDQGDQSINKLVQDLKQLKSTHPNAKIEVTSVGGFSNSDETIKASNKATDTEESLNVARGKTLDSKVKDGVEKEGIKDVSFKIKPISSEDVANQVKSKEGGAGGYLIIKATGLDTEKEVEPPFLKDFEPARGPEDNTVTPVTPDNEPLPSPTPSPVVPDGEITNKITNLGKLNRNGQIATILATINPSLDISKALKQDAITSYTDKFFATTQGDARKIAALIVNIRKNPNTLLNKVSKALDVKLEPRAKAIATRQGRSTQAQLQPIKENTSLVSLLEEAMVDQLSDEDIKKNKKAILSFLGTMYASEGDTQLSIIPKNVADKEELANLGFAPQPGGNYVFLGGRTKDQVLQSFDKQDTKVKLKPDSERLGNTIEQNPTIKRNLSYINTPKELTDLIAGIIGLLKPSLISDKQNLRSVLFGIRNRLKTLKEAEEKDATTAINSILNNKIVKRRFENIDTIEEAIQVILRELFPMLNPTLRDNSQSLRNAIIGASNKLTNDELDPLNLKGKKAASTTASSKPSTTPPLKKESQSPKRILPEGVIKMQKLAGIRSNKNI